MTNSAQAIQSTIDYDIHGVVGLRLINASERARRAVAKQIGEPGNPLERKPDIEIRFTDQIPAPGMIFLGLDAAAFDQNAFYVLKSSKARCKAQIPFEDIGQRKLVITCEQELKSVPLLIALINMTLLSKGCLPLHASTFFFRDRVSLVTGWAKGGKTEALLSFAKHGAGYIADEWTIVDNARQEVFGICEPIRLWDWQLRHVPELRKKVAWKKRMLFKCIHGVNALGRAIAASPLRRSALADLFRESLPAINRQLNVLLHPREIFGGRLRDAGTVDSVFLIMSHDSPDVSVTPCDTAEVVERMISSNQYELLPFWEYYYAFKFAFPDRENSFLETVRDSQYRLLSSAFDGIASYRVLHPYPVELERLFEEMRSYCVDAPLS